MGKKTLAVDIGTSIVRVAEVEAGGGADPREGATLHAFGAASVPAGVIKDGTIEEPGSLAQSIRDAIAAAKPSQKTVTVGIGQPSVIVREVVVPAQPLDKVRSSLAFHVEDQLPMTADEANLDFYPTHEIAADSGTSLRGLLVAAPREVVRDAIEAVEKAGLSVTAVDLNALGLWRSGCRGELMGSNVAFVDVGAYSTTVAVSQGGMPRLVRVMPQGGNDATAALKSALKGTAADPEHLKLEVGMDLATSDPARRPYAETVSHAMSPLIEAVRNTLVYFASSNPGGAVERVVLTGGGSRMAGFGQALASATRLPVMIGGPLQGLGFGKKVSRDAIAPYEQEFATVIGLAMRSEK
ncbi:type IV pilus assembly protein PilM [Demequina zhanjiangensis]|uniref:Type IV pilus assembly protein PilM n=1 Tax=Demequina zhanjiangensis TaxID=3051659 RepID=A0ABT8G2I4_9MICO|nr:type IV pilus assembly protein PilM [Demequina sp. SYSU T00b26]MDN4473350.1 type IV pilus assembly protein PilM [Demequina sp. SYSU T00b26]